MIDYLLILKTNFYGKKWSLFGDSYEGFEWFEDTPKPTQEELDAMWQSTQEQVAIKEQLAKDVKSSALAKLAALGLTQDEVKALVG